MKKLLTLFIVIVSMAPPAFTQSGADSLSDELKAKMFNNLKHFTFGFYVDAYVNLELDGKSDTTNVVPFSSNCPMKDQIRINVAAIEIYYNADLVRGKLALQYGDAPNLLASPEKQFIKTIRQANFGFRVVKDLWIDFGYMFNPIGYESSWAVLNQLSTVTVGGYFSPGSVLGVKLSWKISDKLNGGIMAGNPFSLAYQQNNHLAAIIFLNYQPRKNLTLTYNNFFGNQALRNAEINNNLLYNEFLANWSPFQNLSLVGQFDFAFQSNSKISPDTTKIASMISGFIMAQYKFFKHFAVTGRYELFYDHDGFLSGTYKYDEKITGLTTNGFAFGFEYKPVKIGYIRFEYKFIHANRGNLVYSGNTLDYMNALIFTTGVRF
ncbi:MAG: outer membrane beta-barrel protein [Bacteroidota bacterium]